MKADLLRASCADTNGRNTITELLLGDDTGVLQTPAGTALGVCEGDTHECVFSLWLLGSCLPLAQALPGCKGLDPPSLTPPMLQGAPHAGLPYCLLISIAQEVI